MVLFLIKSWVVSSSLYCWKSCLLYQRYDDFCLISFSIIIRELQENYWYKVLLNCWLSKNYYRQSSSWNYISFVYFPPVFFFFNYYLGEHEKAMNAKINHMWKLCNKRIIVQFQYKNDLKCIVLTFYMNTSLKI